MYRTFLISKIHRAVVTQKDLNYVGSITIDKSLLKEAGMKANEKVEIYNLENGARFATYILEGEENSGIIGINGAAARLVSIGDELIIVNYGLLTEEEMKNHRAKIVLIKDKSNREYETFYK